MADPVVYTDDPDASWTFTITSRDATLVDWVTPLVAVDGGTYTVAGTFLGSAATTRQIRVPLTSLGAGLHRLYLKVPTGTDVLLGDVHVKVRV